MTNDTNNREAPVRVMIVDDSALMRKLLSAALSRDGRVQVVDTAMDGQFALDHLARVRPDVVLMDVDMPRMDGLAALERIVSEHRLPVVMCSTRTTAGAETTIQALARGAVDFIEKPSLNELTSGEAAARVCAAVYGAAGARVKATTRTRAAHSTPAPAAVSPATATPPSRQISAADFERLTQQARAAMPELIAIGTSTGGPPALESVISRLPADYPLPLVIVQHMPPGFTRLLANHLDGSAEIKVREARDGDALTPGLALLCPGGSHMRVVRAGGGYVVKLDDRTPAVCGHRPSVDVLFDSVAESARGRAVGLIMTGMGSDGAKGLGRMAAAGCVTLAQTPDSCVCHGMPKSAIDGGHVRAVLPLDSLTRALVACALPQAPALTTQLNT